MLLLLVALLAWLGPALALLILARVRVAVLLVLAIVALTLLAGLLATLTLLVLVSRTTLLIALVVLVLIGHFGVLLEVPPDPTMEPDSCSGNALYPSHFMMRIFEGVRDRARSRKFHAVAIFLECAAGSFHHRRLVLSGADDWVLVRCSRLTTGGARPCAFREYRERAMSTNNRQKLREAITRAGSEAVAADDVCRLAIELSSRFPQSGLTIDAIEDEIRIANRSKVVDVGRVEAVG